LAQELLKDLNLTTSASFPFFCPRRKVGRKSNFLKLASMHASKPKNLIVVFHEVKLEGYFFTEPKMQTPK